MASKSTLHVLLLALWCGSAMAVGAASPRRLLRSGYFGIHVCTLPACDDYTQLVGGTMGNAPYALSVQADVGQTGQAWVAEVCMLKNQSTQTMQFCADQGVQILGGMGYMRGSACERIYREVKVMTIGGGAEEIMKELAARQLDI